MNGVLFFLLVFFNYLNPISPVVTIIVDLLILVLSGKRRFSFGKSSNLVIRIGFIIWLWSLFVMAINLRFDTYIFFKYLRMPIMAFLLMGCVSSLDFKGKTIINSLYFLCLINLIAVGIELLFPSSRELISQIFRTSREEVGLSFNYRVLGLTGGFEICALLSILLMVVCSYKYKKDRSLFNLVVMFLSFASLAFVSRTGMIVGSAVLVLLMIEMFKSTKVYQKFFVGVFAFAAVSLAIYFVLPIVFNSSGLFDNTMESRYDVDFGRDYGIGTATQLSAGGSHMNILKEPFIELLFGYGINSEDITTKHINTDIGYLEYICHIGFIGLTLVLLMHLLLLKNLIKENKRLKKDAEKNDIWIINRISILYIFLLLVFNYKLMLLYSRGTFELMVILIFAAEKLTNNQKQLWKQTTI